MVTVSLRPATSFECQLGGGATISRATSRIANRGRTAGLAKLAGAGIVVYFLIDLALAFLRPGLSLIHRAESDYAVGPFSWLMDLNFLIRCALSLAAAAAIARQSRGSGRVRIGVSFLAAWGIGSGILAFFPDNPPGTAVTASGAIHLSVAGLAFLCAAIGTIVLSIQFRHLPPLRPIASGLLGISVVAVVPLLLLGSTHFRVTSPAGLYERLFLALELIWILVVSVWLAAIASAPSPAAAKPT